jgi:hypothetical protein
MNNHNRNLKMGNGLGSFGWLCLVVFCAQAAEPVSTVWVRNAQPPANARLARVQPEVHAVTVYERYVEIQSSGLSLYSFGPLQSPTDHLERLRDLRFRIPRQPAPAPDAHASVRPDVLGVFVNGVPIYNQFEVDSYQGQNLWHFDPLAGGDDGTLVAGGQPRPDRQHGVALGLLETLIADASRHSPLLGYALDGYPIYGPWGYAEDGNGLKRLRSGYQLRRITRRATWPDGTELTPGQHGPAVSQDFPLGTFVEDYEYVAGSGDLDEFNGRFASTPEYPNGTYAYFLSTDARGRLAFPYLLAGRYFGQVSAAELQAAFHDELAGSACAVQGGELLAQQRPQLGLRVSGAALTAGEPLRLSFAAQAMTGKPLRFLEYVHERPLHLLIVSEDLAEFAHVHPVLTAGDRYELTYNFTHGGRYRLYADFAPPGGAPRVERFLLDIGGPARSPVPLSADKSLETERAGLKLSLTHSQPLRAGAEIEFALSVRDAKTGQPVDDLEPLLGAWAHFVLIDRTQESFIHAHALEAPPADQLTTAAHVHPAARLGPPPVEIRMRTSFPRPGLYKLWAQLQRGGQVVIQPFVLQVSAAEPQARPARVALPRDAVVLKVGASGFAPAQLTLRAGHPVKLALIRDQLPNCASRIVFPSLGIAREIPLGGTVILELPALPVGEVRFGCGMGMFKGALVVE